MVAKSAGPTQGVTRALAELGHDLREPLAAIVAAASAMETRAFGPLDERYAEHARLIEESARHLLAMADDLLALSGREPRAKTLAPTEPIAEGRRVARLMAPLAAESGVVLRFHATGSSPLARGDDPAFEAVTIRRILINLVANALAHTRADGEVVIEASAAELTVCDTGSGFEASAPEGLGLPIVRRLSNEIGATFAIVPGEGGGTRAVVRFGAAR